MEDFFNFMIAIGVIAFLGIALFAAGIKWDSIVCKEKWELSEYQSKYQITTGCLVSKDGINWIPSENVREI